MDDRKILGGHYGREQEDPQIYRERRRRLADKVGEGTVVIWGNGDDRGYGDVGTFRQDPNFFYLTGVELPNAVLVLRPHDDGYEALFLPPRNEAIERWTGPKLGPDEETGQRLGFDNVLSTDASEVVVDARRRPVPGFSGRLQGWLCDEPALLWTTFEAVPLHAELPPVHRFVAGLRERTPSFSVRDVTSLLGQLRMVKAEGEVALMKKAIDATVKGQLAAARTIRPGVSESEVEGAVLRAFHAAGAEGVAFPSIVGAGYCGTVLHYDQNVGTCSDGELVVVDIGARYGYYCGDVTRTYPVNGRFSDRQRQIYDLVLEAHRRAGEAIRPGAKISELRKIAYTVFEESDLRDAEGGRLGQHFIHGLGHFLGLEAHDPGGDDVVLEPGMVITNEPGLYLQDEGIGVRIEDDHLVTEDGNEVLSARLPRTASELEALMRE